MIDALTNSRLLRAFRLAFYPAFEPAAQKRLQAVMRQAQNASGAGDLDGAEKIYLQAIAENEGSSDPSHLPMLRYGLAHVYQEQRRYRDAEVIFREHLAAAVQSPESNPQVHAAHMGLARLYDEEGNVAEAEEHYKAALAQTENAGPAREIHGSTTLWLARFYVKHKRYADAEPLFQRVVEICAARPSDSSLPHYLREFAKVYEAQGKYAAAEELYRRALTICEELEQRPEFSAARTIDDLARFYRERGRYAEAEKLSRRSLGIVEGVMTAQADVYTKDPKLRRDREKLDAMVKHAYVPISESLDRLAEIYECQEKYAESEPLRKRSVEIKQAAWGERGSWIWVDSLAAYANALHKLGREQEAVQLDERVEAIRVKHPKGSVRSSLRMTTRPLKRTLRGRLATFVNTLRQPSPQ